MRSILTFVLLTICSFSFGQTNLLDASTWTIGTGSAPGFGTNGSASENVREIGVNPHGDSEILWKAVPDATSGPDGGWNSSYLFIDHTKTYRFAVWIKKTNSQDGRTYFGLYSRDASNAHSTLELDGSARSNAYFWYGDLPQLDKWYLLVGYMRSSDYTGTAITGGVYDGVTGAKVLNNQREFKFAPGAVKFLHRNYLFYDTNTADRQFFWGPSIYEVNGSEPTIAELLNPASSSGGGGETVWTASGNDINYTAGKVGIGTSNPDHELTVKGTIHAEEVRVDLSVPAPDYVFKKEYKLKSLSEIQKHIDQYGHLPNIPSAKEMEKNGVALGTMEMKLLEKIEELTLYILMQEKRIKALEKRD